MRSLLLSGLFVCVLAGCSRKALTIAETDQVVTIKNPEQNYFELRTYALPKEVLDLCQESSDEPPAIGLGGGGGRPSFDDEDCIEVSHEYDEVAISAVRENMDRLGYREIDPSTDELPDVALMMGWVARNNWFLGYSPYCYWNWYYTGCWYRPVYTAYNLPTGTLVVDMAVLEDSVAGELASAWTLLFRGLLAESSELSTPDRIRRGVNQGFRQSPYLAEGGDN